MTHLSPAETDIEPSSVDEESPGKAAIVQASTHSPPDRKVSEWLAFLRRHKWFLAMATIAVLAGLYVSFRYFKGTEVPVDIARRADLIETVVASGHVESPFRVDISSQITGTVVSVAVREGEIVRKGQTLILLAADELQSSAAQARGAVAQAEAHVRQLSELSLPQAIEAQKSAESSLLATLNIFDRASVLMAKGFVTRAYFDDAKKNRDVARAAVVTAIAQVRSVRAGGSDFATAQADLTQSKAALSAATTRLAYTTISAPRAGVLISRAVERGTVVTAGTSLMILSPVTETQIVLQIDERNLGKIAVEQSARISADAYPQQQFAATVAFINPGIDITRASVMVKLSVPNPPAYLRQDMTVSVDIVTAQRKAVLSLPRNAIHDALTSAPWVMIVDGKRAVRKNIRLGLQGNNRIEILNGIESGAMVIAVASTIITGARVNAIVK
jgi:HlyD family secretion protein